MAFDPTTAVPDESPSQFDPSTAKPVNSSTLRKAADLGLGFASGAIGATRALSDAFGAGNAVSRGLKSAGEGVDSLLTPEAQDAQYRQSQILDEAKGKGIGAGLSAAGRAFMEAPVQTAVQGLGSVVPLLATAAIPGALPARIAAGAMGAGMGVGTAKGAIRDEIEKRELAAGKTAAQAAAAADAAQSYSGPNTDQIALGGALGVADAAFGVAPAAVGMLRRKLGREAVEQVAGQAGEGIIKAGLKGAAKEAPVEFAQGGQEQVAANIAAQRAGFEAGTFDGAVAQGGFEALASAGPGAGFGILNRPREAAAAPPAVNPLPAAPSTPPIDPAAPSADAAAINQEQAGGLQRTFDPRAGVSPPLSLTPLNTEGGIPYEAPAPKPFGQNFTTTPGETLSTALPERPSVAMGLDPAIGGLTAAAALAVDSGAAPAVQGFGIRRRTVDFTDVTPITAAAGQIETPRRIGESAVFDVQAREVNTDQPGIAAARRLPFTNPGAPNGPQAQEALTSEPRSEEAPAAGVIDVARTANDQRARNLAALKQRMQASRPQPPAADAAGSQPVPPAQGQDAGALSGDANVQNAPQPAAAAQAKTPAGEAPAPAGRDAAPASGVPATPGAGDVQADGVTTAEPGDVSKNQPKIDTPAAPVQEAAKSEQVAAQSVPEKARSAEMKKLAADIQKSADKLAKMGEVFSKQSKDGFSRARTTTYNARAGSEAERQKASKKMLSKLVRSALRDGQQVPQEILDAAGSGVDYNDAGKYEPVSTPTAPPAPKPDAGPELLGRNSQPLSEGGKPFKTEADAKAAKKLHPTKRVIKAEGGFVLAPKTPKQIAADAEKAKRLRQFNSGTPGKPMSAHEFVVSEGGMSAAARADLGVDGNPRVGNRTLFAGQGKPGLTLEQAAMKLKQAGYITNESESAAADIIKRSLRDPQYTPEGVEAVAEAEREAEFQDYLNAAQEPVDENADDFDPFGPSPDFSPAELADAGYDEATTKIKAEVDALIAMAEAQGIDTETLREDAARATADQTEQEYYEQARSAINAAISQSAASRRSDSAVRDGQGQQGEAQRGGGEDRVAPAGEQGGEGLTAPTRADIEAQQARAEQAANSKAAKDKADAAREAKERERADVKRLSEAAANTFELGGDAMANLTGQTDIFGSAPEVEPTPAPAPQADDLDAMFDDLMGEVAPAPAPPAARAPRAPRPQAAQRPAPRTAGQAAAGAAKNTASALNNAIDGLGALFGANSKGRLGSGLSFDENTYQQAKPLFIQAIANLKDAGSDIREAMRAVIKMVVDKFGADTATAMKPYIVRFTSDVRDGTITQEDINAASADTNLERDSRQPAAEPAVGDPVPGDARGSASDAGQDDAQGDGQPGLTRIQADGTPADRKRGDQRVSDRVGQAGIEEFDAGADIGEPSGATGDTGIPPEPIPASAVVSAAEGGIAKQRALYQQRQAESVAVKAGDLANIKATLPYLLEGQQEDVLKAETRFAKEDGYGMLFTNGTGTGKTFSGLGVVKRFAKQGKTNTLIVVPDEKIMSDWIESAKALGLTATQLKDTKDAGSGITVTTYANMGANDALASRNWDLVVADEAHTLMMSADGKMTGYLQNLRAITMHPDGAYQRYVMQNRADIDQLTALATQITNNNKVLNNLDTMDAMLEAVRSENAKLQAQADKLDTKLRAIRDKVREQVDTSQGAKRTRSVFLSATPFAYEKTVDWANGYLFDYNEGREAEGARSRRYNEGSNREQFFMQNFGYSMRYGKLTEPDSKLVDRGLMQRQFNAMLKKRGSLSGRVLDVPADYDRRFVLLNSAIGNEIDNAITWIEENRKAHNQLHKDAKKGETPPNGYDFMQTSLNELLYGPQGHLLRRYLLEAIKAKEVVPIIREHLAMGRKVVVFHDFKKGGSVNPFKFMRRPEPSEKEAANPVVAASLPAIRAYNKAVAEFDAKFPRLSGGLDLAGLLSPVERFTKEFPGVLLINGDEKKSDLLQRYKTFNDDATGPVVALVQSAKNKGWSGHDTTGKHQRVLFNLGLPTQPTMSIQQEGRIYRTGQVSNAIFRYLNTGTNWERWAFAQTIADRASAAENLGSGELSRALKDAFISGFEESDTYAPGHEGEGTGGKERDKASNNAMSEWDRAKSFYFGTQKKNSRTKAQEGTDYFATPEPIGLKMVQWLKLRGGESALEPSGGHGAIARWIPETASRTVIEPSSALRSRLAMVMNPAEDRILDGQFEDLDVVNKFDGIAMNPPFGTAGRMAIDHLAKAATHLRDGGRIVAIIPTGPAADKKFDKWLYEVKEQPVKPLAQHPTLGAIYKGDTVNTAQYSNLPFADGRTKADWIVQGAIENGKYLSLGAGGVAIYEEVGPEITAIQPTGKRVKESRPTKDLHLVADIKMPGVTFERAGTTVATRIVVIEKQTDAALAPDAKNFDFTGADNIATLFDRMENIDLPERKMTAAQQAKAEAGAEKQKATPAKDRAAKKQPEPVVERGDAKIITYTTKAGKELRGIIRTDLTKEQAQKIDPYTWKMQGGFFIREKYLKPAGDAPAFSRGGAQSVNRNVGDAPAAEAQRVQAAIEGKGLIDAARFLTQSANKARAAVAQKVLDKLERLEKAGVDLRLNIVHRGDMVPADLANSRGYTETGFDEKGRDIAVWLNGADVTGKVGTEEEVLLHELVHAATTGMVFYGNRVPDSLAGRHAKDLMAVTDAIADHITRRFADADAGKANLTDFEQDMRAGANNAFRSDDEVLAWALSNADAQAYLDGIPYKSGSMWSNFVQSVRTLLGLTPAMDTALSEVLRVADRMLTEDAPQTGRAAFWHKRGLRMVQQQGRGSLVQRQDRADGANPANPGSRFSRGIPASTAKQITDAIRARWANAPEIVVAANMQDPAVPERVRQEDAKQRSQGASGEPEGFYYGGKVYLVASALKKPTDVVRVLFHEALGHAGLRGVFGESLTPILKQLAVLRRADVAAKASEYGLNMSIEAERLQAAEEVLAVMAQTKPELGYVQRAVAAVRAFLRKNVPGFASMKLTDADIINSFILPARRFVERGPGGGPRGGQNSWMPAFQRAYHGSPHRFDKFTTGAIGAGEGAQVYGYGLYFASKQDVAEHYRVNLSAETRGDTNNWQYQGRDVTMNEHINKAPGRHPEISESDAKNAAFLASEYVSGNRDTPSEDRLQRSDVGRAIQKEMAGLKRTQGQLYEVEIPEDADMLLWDKPLSEMPAKVKDAILYDMGVSGRWQNDTGMRRFIEAPRATDTGQQAYRTLSRLLGSDKAASDALAAAGVKGIKYLDGDSRAGSDGTFNYVVFSDDDVAIQSTMFSRFNAGDAKIPAFDDIRNPKENLSEVGSSLSTSFKIIGKRTVPMESLMGAMSTSAGDAKRAQDLAEKLKQEGSFFERVIVDDAGNVIEGQHRVAALRLLGAKTVPAVVIQDFMRDFDAAAVGKAMTDAQPMNSDSKNRLVGLLAEIYADEKGDIAEIGEYEVPRGFAKAWGAGIEALTKVKTATPMFSRANAGAAGVADLNSDTWTPPAPSKWDDYVFQLQDKNIDLKRVTQAITEWSGKLADNINVYLQEELYHGRTAKRVQEFSRLELEPALRQLAADGYQLSDLEEYLHARHAKEANRVIAERNPTQAMIDAARAKAKSEVERLEFALEAAPAGMRKALKDQLKKAKDERKRWRGAAAFKGTEAERLMLSGMSDAAADSYFAQLPQADKDKLGAVAAQFDKIMDETSRLMVEYELESQDTVDSWAKMYQHYIPLQREDKDGGSRGTGQGFSIKGRETKGRTGSTRKVVDIVANIANAREKAVVRGEKNRVAQALVGMVAANPNKDFWKVGPPEYERVFNPATGKVENRINPAYKSLPNVVIAKVAKDGAVKEVAVTFNEDDERAVRMAGALKNLDTPQIEGWLGNVAKITRYFASINTQYNPIFGVVNLVRDIQGAAINLAATPLADKKMEVSKDAVRALAGIYQDIRATRKGGVASSKWSKLYEQFQHDGGQTGFRNMFETSADRTADLTDKIDPEAWAKSDMGKFFSANGQLVKPMNQIRKGTSVIFDWLSDYNEAMENGVRLAAYKAALDKGMSRQQAASLAKNLTVNFNRKGLAGNQAGAVYAFFNAAMQGTARIGQALTTMDPGKPSTIRLSPLGKKIVYGGMLLGSMQALALAGAGFGDDEPPDFVREKNLVIPTGGKTYISIPMPLGLHVIPSLGRIATEFALDGFESPVQRATQVAGLFADAFNPIGNAGMSMQTLAPTVLDPFVALTENKDYTGKPIARVAFNKDLPGFSQHKDSASIISKFLAEAINTLSGGNEYVAGVFSPTPDQIDYLAGQLGGGVWRELSKLEQTATGTVTGEDTPIYKVPLVGRFVGSAAGQAGEGNKFYSNANKLNRLETEIKGLMKDGKTAEAAALRAENPEARLIVRFNMVERQVQKLRKQKSELIKSGDQSDQVRVIEQRITDLMANMNRVIGEIEASQ